MALQALSLETIEDFLAQRRIALIGVSRKLGSFSVPIFQEPTRRGYDVVPVNPNTPEFPGGTAVLLGCRISSPQSKPRC